MKHSYKALLLTNSLYAKKKGLTRLYQTFAFLVVRGMRFELTRVAPYAPQTYASTNSATPAAKRIIGEGSAACNNEFRLSSKRVERLDEAGEEKARHPEINKKRGDVHDGREHRLGEERRVFLEGARGHA